MLSWKRFHSVCDGTDSALHFFWTVLLYLQIVCSVCLLCPVLFGTVSGFVLSRSSSTLCGNYASCLSCMVFSTACSHISVPNFCVTSNSQNNLVPWVRSGLSATIACSASWWSFHLFRHWTYGNSIPSALYQLFVAISQKCPPEGVQIGIQFSDTPEAHTVRALVWDFLNLSHASSPAHYQRSSECAHAIHGRH